MVPIESESLFLMYVRVTLNKWIGFQAALKEGMGGPYASEKVAWLEREIENFFKRYAHVMPTDLEEYIGNIMENEFDTYFEDGSLLEISNKFIQAHELSLVNPCSPVFDEVHKILEERATTAEAARQACQNREANAARSIDAGMQQLNLNGNGTEDDDWTLVTRKGHHK